MRSIAEFGLPDPDINALSDKIGIAVAAAVAETVRAGVASGERRARLNAAALGRLLLCLSLD